MSADYIKIKSLPVSAEKVLNNDLLAFTHSNIDFRTGEKLSNRPQTAEYGNMKIVVRDEKVGMNGSLHKQHEGGTNHGDFHLSDIQTTVEELAATVVFDPAMAFLNFCEVGLNIPLDYSPSDLIKTLVVYKTTPFQPLQVKGKGYGKKAETQRFTIKVYNKSLQYGLNRHLLRFEVKVTRMQFLAKYGIHSLSLADLTKEETYPKFLKMLLDTLDGILFYDPELNPDDFTGKDRELVMEGRYSDFWTSLPRQRKSEKLKRFGELAKTEKIKAGLAEKIKQKWNELTTISKDQPGQINHFSEVNGDGKTGQINHFSEQPEKGKTGQINTYVNCYSVRCPITNLELNHQAPGKYLTKRGIKWYFENEPEIYRAKLETLLTKKWVNRHKADPKEKYFGEIAHQIRNRFYNEGNNPRNNTKRSYRNIQSKGLKLFEIEPFIKKEKKIFLTQMQII